MHGGIAEMPLLQVEIFLQVIFLYIRCEYFEVTLGSLLSSYTTSRARQLAISHFLLVLS
jgi:hypothetical protein